MIKILISLASLCLICAAALAGVTEVFAGTFSLASFDLDAPHYRDVTDEWFMDPALYTRDSNWNILGVIVPEIDVTINDTRIQIAKSEFDKRIARERFSDLERFLNVHSHGQMSATLTTLTLQTPVTLMSSIATTSGRNGWAIGTSQMVQLLDGYVDITDFDHIMFFLRTQCETVPVSVSTSWAGLYHGTRSGVHFSQIIFSASRNCTWHNTSVFPEQILVHEFIHGLENQSRDRNIQIPSSIDTARSVYGYGTTRQESMRFYRDWLNRRIISPQDGNRIGATGNTFLRYRAV